MVKRVLMVAYHFPPMNESSGLQRTLRFAQYLPEAGWDPVVLTADPRAYSRVSEASMADVPQHVHVHRAFALDTARHLSWRGRYPTFLSVPDRWWSWWPAAVCTGLSLVRRLKPSVLWSTYPIATAHVIAYTLHRLTGIPWVADFRDPMAQDGYPETALEHRAFEWVEWRTLQHCRRAVFTARGAMELYAQRYPGLPASRLSLIENGYDESAFAQAEQASDHNSLRARPLVLLHSGTIYPSERDPRPFLAALGELRETGRVTARDLQIVLRATGCDDYLRGLIHGHGLEDIVTLAPAVPYRAALAEMLAADGLLVLQASNCNYQVPAKLYEYLRAGRPVLALTDPEGDTAGVLRDAGVDTIAPLDCQQDISRVLLRFMDLLREHRAPLPRAECVQAASRKMRTMQLARELDAVVLH